MSRSLEDNIGEEITARVLANSELIAKLSVNLTTLDADPTDLALYVETANAIAGAFVETQLLLMKVASEYEARHEAEEVARKQADEEMYWRNRRPPGFEY